MKSAPKTARKSVKKRIAIHTLESSEFVPTAEQWNRLEAELGATLLPSVRIDLVRALRDCIDHTYAETSTPFVDNVDAAINRVKEAASALEQAIWSGGETERSALVYLSVAYREHAPSGSDLRDFSGKLSALISACASVRSDLGKMDYGPAEGEAWTGLVRRVRRLFRANEFPAGAAKAGPLSPFLKFLKALADLNPAFARHTQTDSALQTAVHRARKLKLNTKKPAAARPDDPNGSLGAADNSDE